MAKGKSLISAARIENTILFIRGQKVMLDSDLAEMYGVSTRRLNEQVKRNADRFPEDFMFQLTAKEYAFLMSQIATSNATLSLRSQIATSNRGGRRYMPYVFTEFGAVMAANVLNTTMAVRASIYVVRAFVKLGEVLSTHGALAAKLELLENKFDSHDKEIQVLFEAIRQLMNPPNPPRKRIGFKIGKEK